MGLAITWLSERTCQATFLNNPPTQEALEKASNFTIESQSGISMAVYRSEPTAGVGTTILHVGPSVYPGGVYTIKFGDEVSVSQVPDNIVPQESSEWSHKMIDALTEAFGEAVQRLSGKPQTLVVSNFASTDSVLFVETTLGFPEKGKIFVGSKKYSYTEKDAMSFRGITPHIFYNTGVSPQTMVTCDVDSIFPG